MGGGVAFATNFPPVYHIEHDRDNSPSVRNSDHLRIRGNDELG
jgi:hypothetical protein